MIKEKKSAFILSSGGLDSTATINYYIDAGFKAETLFIDFGQPASRNELIALRKISKHYKIENSILRVRGFRPFKHGLVQGRNLFLISSALMFLRNEYGIIALGIHAGTNYMDCGSEFVERVNHLLDMYTGGKLVLGTPFINFTKPEIFEYCKIKKVPMGLTYSCELGLKQPCNICSSCKDLIKLYAGQNQYIKASKRN
jgi:7-cyano-7-deazaguanine synthase